MNKGLSGKNEKRVNDVYSLICQGARHSEIVEYCEKKYNVKKRRAEYYITEARKKIKEITKQNLDDLRAEAVAKYNELYRLAIKDNDYRTACYILSRIDRINALETFNFKHDFNSNVFEKLNKIFEQKIEND